MGKPLPVVAHPAFTTAVLRLPLPRRKEIYIALRAIERGELEPAGEGASMVCHLDLPSGSKRVLRLVLVRGLKSDREFALAVDAFWTQPGHGVTRVRARAAQQAWDAWKP